jgi:putative effector of murein hydrolase LrgA (UPF0299 family)
VIHGLFQLLLFQAAGELVSRFLVTFIPGPVIGLVLLLAFLLIRGNVPKDIDAVGGGILQHLGLLFVPASVGVLMFWPLLRANAWAVAAALLASVIATIAVTALVLRALAPLAPEDERAP